MAETISTPEIELAWAAGFLDGEGTIYFRGQNYVSKKSNRTRTYGTFGIQAAQVDRAVLDRLHSALGVGKVYGPYRARPGNRKPYFAFSAAGLLAVEAYARVRPYLSPIKRAQGDVGIEKYKAQASRPKLINQYGPRVAA